MCQDASLHPARPCLWAEHLAPLTVLARGRFPQSPETTGLAKAYLSLAPVGLWDPPCKKKAHSSWGEQAAPPGHERF